MTDSKSGGTIKSVSWKDLGFDPNMRKGGKDSQFIAGESFDIRLDELTFNRLIQFRNLDQKPQGNDPGKIYFDPVTKKLKMWIDTIGQWAEVLYTTTSTSTSTTSSSSSSISTTSSSTSTTSSSISTTSSSTSTT